MEDVHILGIESSCDETSMSIVKNGREILSNVVSSQVDIFEKFGGVIPEVASREHVKNVSLVYEETLKCAGINSSQIDAIAVTEGPGLVGSLLIGITAAKALALKLNKPLIGVNHIAGHIYASYTVKPFQFPLIVLVASGAHTEIVLMKSHYDFTWLGGTVDDAVGEVFDKIARILDLPYPGGPHIERLAKNGTPSYDFPKSFYKDGTYNFSFSGIKSSVFNFIHNAKQRNEEICKENIASSFQKAVFDVMIDKTLQAAKQYNPKNIIVAGGVGANLNLRERLELEVLSQLEGTTVIVPPLNLCTDNAAMIAAAGTILYEKGYSTPLNFKVQLSSELKGINQLLNKK